MTTTERPQRMKAKDRKADLLQFAVKAAETHGFAAFRSQHVADMAGVSQPLIMLYFHTVKQLRRSVMRAAIKDANLKVIAAGLGLQDPDARKAPPELKEAALKLLSM